MPNRLRHCAIGLLLAGSLWSAVVHADAASPRSPQATLDARLAAINGRDTDARMRLQLRPVRETGDIGVALLKYESQAQEADGWRLVYDQNTVIPPATP